MTAERDPSVVAPEVVVGPALVREAEAVLKLQYLAYQTEAALYDDWAMPPLTQSLASLLGEYDTHEVLVARLDGELVGSVRGTVTGGAGGAGEVGRLLVHPRLQGRGVGTRLLGAVEERLVGGGASRFELFTGHRSEGNLRLYRRCGYREFRDQPVSPALRLVYLEKTVVGGSGRCTARPGHG